MATLYSSHEIHFTTANFNTPTLTDVFLTKYHRHKSEMLIHNF